MIGVAFRNLARRKLRALLTGLAVIIGVAMIAGTYVLTDSISGAFGNIFKDAYRGADAVVTPKSIVDGDIENAPTIPASVVAQLSARPDVAAATGAVASDTGARLTTKQGTQIDTKGGPALALGVDPAIPELAQVRIVDGRLASGPTEVVIDTTTAAEHNYAVGDSIGVQTDSGTRRFTITGLGTFGNQSLGSATVAVFDVPTAQDILSRGTSVDEVLVKAADGTSAADLTRTIAATLPATLQARTGAAEAAAQTADVKGDLKFINMFLLTFAGIALFVGSFVIFNTLAITIAQRTRELATMRTLGASRRQVAAGIVAESAVIGIVASLVGIAAGLGLAGGLNALFRSLGVDLPSKGLVLEPRTVIVSLVVGTLVTIAASLMPALRAGRVAPIAAIREGAKPLEASRSRRLRIAGAIAAAGGAGLLVWSVVGDMAVRPRLTVMGAGLGGAFIGIALLLPLAIEPLARFVGAPVARVTGEAGRLGRENTMRNPGRTASTAAALMIGLALMTFVAVLGSGLMNASKDALSQQLTATHVVSKSSGFETLTPGTARALADVSSVSTATSVRSGIAKIGDDEVPINGVDPATLGSLYRIRWALGSDATLASLADDKVVVDSTFAKDRNLDVGSSLTLTAASGVQATFTVAGTTRAPRFDPLIGPVLMTQRRFDDLSPRATDAFVFVRAEGNPDAARNALAATLGAQYPDADVQTRAAFVDVRSKSIVQLLNLLYVLLGLSVVIGMFGMLNTLALAVVERTREVGMLRAVGMSRRQVRRMIRSEGITTALIGAGVGMPVGIGLAALATRALNEFEVGFSLPVSSLVVFVVAAIAIGVIAAALPARRAARLDVLRALQYE